MPAGAPGPRYFQRAFLVVVVATAAHVLLAFTLLWLMPHHPPRAGEAVAMISAATAVVRLAVFYLRSQYAGADHVTQAVPWAGRIAPPLAAAVLLPLTLPPSTFDRAAAAIEAVAPILAATWSSAMLVALAERRTLHALAIRTPTERVLGSAASPDPPTLAGSYARTLFGATLAAAVLMLGASLDDARVLAGLPDLPAVLGLVGVLLLLAGAAVAGAGLGHSPGRDVTSIASRLDTLGYNARQNLAFPVVVTSFDEVGDLFAKLELLRMRLARESALYEDALDKTRDADAVKSEFLGAVSHELRTPLNSVCGFAQLLLEGTPTPLTTPQTEDVRLIQAGGQQLLGLINDILDISMIESGEMKLALSREDVGIITDEVVRSHQPLVRDRSVSLSVDVGPDVPSVVCDRRRISQIVTNLVSNAVKFTERGEIRASVAYDHRQDHVLVRVSDTGIGIAPDELDAIFEEYRQAGALKWRKKGTGLGLAIARSLAWAHGGSLTVESELGHGSVFVLALPRVPAAEPAAGEDDALPFSPPEAAS